MKELAPIALFVYNRPEHSLKTLKAIQANPESSSSILYIYADGARKNASPKEKENIATLRKMIRSQKWCAEVVIREADENQGLAASIVKGVGEVLEQHGKIIVLEDDIVGSSGFLSYMNRALDQYEHEEKVMHISAYMPDIKRAALPSTFFLRFMSCWGWGTWKSAWDKYIPDSHYLLERLLSERELESFNLGGSIKFHNYLKGNLDGSKNSWAIKWFSSIYFSGGLCLSPRQSLVQNIGFDGSGTHYNTAVVKRDPMLVEKPIDQLDIDRSQKIEEHFEARKALAHFYKYKNNFTPTNIIRSNLRWMKQRILFLKDYYQKDKFLTYEDSSRVHA
ncbi:MAG: hypothetical protein AAF696_17125 [Bacteroidota bacterium]